MIFITILIASLLTIVNGTPSGFNCLGCCYVCGRGKTVAFPDKVFYSPYSEYSCAELEWKAYSKELDGSEFCLEFERLAPLWCGCIPGKIPTPTSKPTPMPTHKPTRKPTRLPTRKPISRPTPTPIPSHNPTRNPTSNPTRKPTRNPTRKPTRLPTRIPIPKPTPKPTRPQS